MISDQKATQNHNHFCCRACCDNRPHFCSAIGNKSTMILSRQSKRPFMAVVTKEQSLHTNDTTAKDSAHQQVRKFMDDCRNHKHYKCDKSYKNNATHKHTEFHPNKRNAVTALKALHSRFTTSLLIHLTPE